LGDELKNFAFAWGQLVEPGAVGEVWHGLRRHAVTARRAAMARLLRRDLRPVPQCRYRSGTGQVPRAGLRRVRPAGHGHATERHIAEHGDANTVLWFEHELRQYPAANLDIDALTAHADRILPAVGRESRGYPCYEVTWELGRKLGRDGAELPGGHLGCMTHSVEFATRLVRALAPDRTPSR
jgi:hypothetical protein